MSIWSNPGKVAENLWDGISHLFSDKAKPYIKGFLMQFAHDEGELILSKCVAAAPRLKDEPFNQVAASILTDIIAGSATIAAKDATKTLLEVQSALQVAKVESGIITPSDEAVLAKVAA